MSTEIWNMPNHKISKKTSHNFDSLHDRHFTFNHMNYLIINNTKLKSAHHNGFNNKQFQSVCIDTGAVKSVCGIEQAVSYCRGSGKT